MTRANHRFIKASQALEEARRKFALVQAEVKACEKEFDAAAAIQEKEYSGFPRQAAGVRL